MSPASTTVDTVYIAISTRSDGGVHLATSIPLSDRHDDLNSPAQTVAGRLMRQIRASMMVTSVTTTPDAIPAMALLLRCMDPEDYGHAVSDEVRSKARAVLAAAIPGRFGNAGGPSHG